MFLQLEHEDDADRNVGSVAKSIINKTMLWRIHTINSQSGINHTFASSCTFIWKDNLVLIIRVMFTKCLPFPQPGLVYRMHFLPFA